MNRLTLCLMALLTAPLWAAEGMWTLDNLPRAQLQSAHDFSPDAAWVEQVQRASVRLAGGCSGSFVSPQGLILTNHHCIADCVAQLSTADEDLMRDGFLAITQAQERQCPDIEVNQLVEIRDVTERVQAAATDLDASAANAARKAAKTAIESECVGAAADSLRCDVVTLYHGGRHHLYRYRRYQDVRLAFAPEIGIAFFGGDPDNFNFPRYVLDMGLLRVYQDGKPAPVEHYFRWDASGAEDGELVFVTGHPGATQRLLTTAQLATLRDTILPERLVYLAELRGLLSQFASEGTEQARISQGDLFSVENAFKALRGRHAALVEPGFFEAKLAAENALREAVDDKRRWRGAYGGAWAAIAEVQPLWRDIYTEYSFLEVGRGFSSELFDIARHLVRAAAEREKPDGQRLREYSEAALPRLTQTLFSSAPVYPALERLTLGWSLEKLREYLGADHPAVRDALGREAPQRLAEATIAGTRLTEVDYRRTLWEGGTVAIAAADDPMIALARRVDAAARAVRQRYQDAIEAVEDREGERIAQAQFAVYGTDSYPDATFSLRLSYGQVRGWREGGEMIPPFTTIQGAFERATGNAPYALPPSWHAARDRMDTGTRMNFVTTHDIIGGNSGSPVINREARIVGLIFDGNIHSLGGAYAYDERYNRAVAVHSATMLEALETVYNANRLVDEIRAKTRD